MPKYDIKDLPGRFEDRGSLNAPFCIIAKLILNSDGTGGIIALHEYENNHDQEWTVESECDRVRIVSTHFDTEGGFDHVTIGDQEYSGSVEIDQVVGPSFTVAFASDGSVTKTGFELTWSCDVQVLGKFRLLLVSYFIHF